VGLTHLAVRGFQSLKQVDLDLGTFTVIVGPSSSGKSALIRAFRALASNVRGSGVITRGQKQMAITATLDDGLKVTLERGDRSSAYRLTGDGDHQFTKLAGEVPELVSKALRLDPGADSINFAGQFDKPYLLDESGATVARQLGELTNVNTIFEAVRSANKIRASAQSTLKTRRADLEDVKTGLKEFSGLSTQLKALTVVQALNGQRTVLQSRLGRLETAIGTLRVTETALEKYRPFDLPDPTGLLDAVDRARTLHDRMENLTIQQQRADDNAVRVVHEQQRVAIAERNLAETLKAFGVCPTCNQKIRQ
jgi:DNA repair ATPase RecN